MFLKFEFLINMTRTGVFVSSKVLFMKNIEIEQHPYLRIAKLSCHCGSVA
jgi:hypothetical protein